MQAKSFNMEAENNPRAIRQKRFQPDSPSSASWLTSFE